MISDAVPLLPHCSALSYIQQVYMFTFAVPSAVPDDVAVEVMNSSSVKVSWTLVHKDRLNGHLGGYRVISQKQTFAFTL